MTTKPPSTVREFAPEAIEKIAYGCVSEIPTQEPNDRNRLGYHVWRLLTTKQGTLEQTIVESGARISIPREEARRMIAEALAKHGITLP
ncbi:MAG TPA: hypothetical protein VLY03_03630 [Bacteroidota bacterium]|nr:hypothetical protein [Bacteroidota bacterium]